MERNTQEGILEMERNTQRINGYKGILEMERNAQD
jgi:hypothetical protein